MNAERIGHSGLFWLLVSAFMGMLCLLGGLHPADLLAWNRDDPFDGLRIWTAGFVHWGGRHLAVNLAGLLLLGLLGYFVRLPWHAAYAWILSIPLTHAWLVYAQDIRLYAGLSGVLHAGAAVAAVYMIAQPSDQFARRPLGLILAGGLALKILVEAPWISGLQASPEWSFPVATGSHAAGALAGTLVGGHICALFLIWEAASTRRRANAASARLA